MTMIRLTAEQSGFQESKTIVGGALLILIATSNADGNTSIQGHVGELININVSRMRFNLIVCLITTLVYCDNGRRFERPRLNNQWVRLVVCCLFVLLGALLVFFSYPDEQELIAWNKMFGSDKTTHSYISMFYFYCFAYPWSVIVFASLRAFLNILFLILTKFIED